MSEERHLLHSRVQTYAGRNGASKGAFSKFFDSKLRELNELNEQTDAALKKRDIAASLGISQEMFRKIVNMQKPTKKRDCIIAICAVLRLDSTDTNEALYLYGNMPQLDDYKQRDEVLMTILDNQCYEPLSINDINDILIKRGFLQLDIHDHRMQKKIILPDFPYTLLEKRVECESDVLIYGDQYDSLETTYNPYKYSVRATMWLDDNDKRGYKLCADSDSGLSRTNYPISDDSYHHISSMDDTGEFQCCFIELQKMVREEYQRMMNVLNDTRNYHERSSAKVIDGELHVFYETYNYWIPELGEYFLMDYVNGQYTLYVSRQSWFMRLYLSPQEYSSLCGKGRDKIDMEYDSVEAIENAIMTESSDRKAIVKLRIRAFTKAKKEIDSLIESLKEGKVFIRNMTMIYDNPYDVLRYFKVTDEYQCTYHPDCDEINGVGVDSYLFSLSDGRKVELSVDDLNHGFQLGLRTVEDVGAFLLKHSTLMIEDLL